MESKRLVIIDGFSLLFRAFYGTGYLSTSDGRPTNALFGFCTMLFNLLEQVKPTAIVVAFDAPGKTFRHADFADYKGHRSDPPPELTSQLVFSRELVGAFQIPCLELTGYEADDIVGTLSQRAEQNGYHTTIVTGDLDSLQLVDDCVSVMTTRRGVSDVVIYGPKEVDERYGFGPEFVTDYKALVGDTSDNIPGVPGIGQKTATLLIQQFGGIEQIIDRMEEIPEKFRKKLVGNEDTMRLSKKLATIVRDCPLEYDFAPYTISSQQLADAQALMTTLEFRTLGRKLESVLQAYSDGPRNAEPVRVSTEQIEFTEKAGKATADQLDQWVGSKRFALVPPDGPAQRSLLDEETPQEAYIAVGSEVWACPWETAVQFALDRPEQLVAHDSKAIYKADPFRTQTPPGFDATLAGYVLQSGRSAYDLGDLVQGYLDFHAPASPQEKAVALLHLEPVLTERLEKEQQTHVYQDVEVALVPILAEMEAFGITLSTEYLREYSGQLQQQINQTQQNVYSLAGEDFNIGSPKQIGEILFEKLELPGGKRTKTGWATGVEILGEMSVEHEIVREILNYRELTKLKGTYTDSLPKLVKSDGRLHTTYNQTVAATGRLSSNDPNLQNIPIRTELGRQIRQAFVAEQGYVLASFDYSQIELRILAHMCKDPDLVKAFQDRVDVHTVTAAEMFGLPNTEVTKEQRRLAKMLNYAVLYGVTGFGLANQLGTGFSIEDAGRLIKQYNERFPSVKGFTTETVEEARSKGFTTTLIGRRRYFPDIHAGNRVARAYAERQAMNAPIQGTAADMIKLAMIECRKHLEGAPHRMLLQVHDELVFEMTGGYEEQVEPIRALMEGALPLDVPVEVDAKMGQNWLDMQPVLP